MTIANNLSVQQEIKAGHHLVSWLRLEELA